MAHSFGRGGTGRGRPRPIRAADAALRRVRAHLHTKKGPDDEQAAHLAPDEELERAGVDAIGEAPAFEGVGIIRGEVLQTPEEARASERVTERRDRPGTLRTILALNVGTIFCAIAFVVFQAPNHLAFGGSTGLSIVISSLIPAIRADVALWIVNVALVVIGLVFVDRSRVLWSVAASLAISAYSTALSHALALTGSVTGDVWLDLCCAVLLIATGNAIAYNAGASTGGTEILVMVLARRTSLPVGHAVAVTNASVVCASVALRGPRIGLYCVLGLVIQTFVVGLVLDDLKQHKVCTVICDQPARVEEFVVRELNRTATVSYGYGVYSGRRVAQVMCVLTRSEAQKLQRFVRSLDPNTFITYVNTSQITGRGFRWV